VELAVRRDGDTLVFTVADKGPGIPIAEAERIFQPFYRHADTAPDVGRAGLGLSIARRLAEIQHGSLTYEPRPGGGSVFVLKLPAVDIEDE
jgi:two-component system sensor histidine kinase KdpD